MRLRQPWIRPREISGRGRGKSEGADGERHGLDSVHMARRSCCSVLTVGRQAPGRKQRRNNTLGTQVPALHSVIHERPVDLQ